jgi:hypothetical protein
MCGYIYIYIQNNEVGGVKVLDVFVTYLTFFLNSVYFSIVCFLYEILVLKLVLVSIQLLQGSDDGIRLSDSHLSLDLFRYIVFNKTLSKWSTNVGALFT